MMLRSGGLVVTAVTSPVIQATLNQLLVQCMLGLASPLDSRDTDWWAGGLNCPNAACAFLSTLVPVNKRSAVTC